MTPLSLHAVLVLILVHLGQTVSLRLTDENYEKATVGKFVFLKISDPNDCDQCTTFEKVWERVDNDWEDNENVVVAAVDCSQYDSEDLCDDNFEYSEEENAGLALHYGDPDSLDDYEAERDYETLSKFIEDNLNKPSCSVFRLDVCDENDKKIITELQTRSVSELRDMKEKADEEIERVEMDIFEKNKDMRFGFENEDSASLSKIFEEMMNKTAEVSERYNYKWVRQLLLDQDEDDESDGEAEDPYPYGDLHNSEDAQDWEQGDQDPENDGEL